MTFIDFARAHGVIINSLAMDGRWHRVPTVDHPHKKNGAYKFMGDHGHVQNWAEMTEAATWTAEGDNSEGARVDRAAIEARARLAQEQIKQDQERAIARAVALLKNSVITTHPYLEEKGFPDARGAVYWDEKAQDNKLCLPMKVDGRIVGLQTISDQLAHERIGRDGKPEQVPSFEKRFMYGQRTSDAVYMIDNKGPKVFCEGYATGLSVARALHAARQRFTLFITFTAGNMLRVAKNHGEGLVITDHDRPSQAHPNPGGHGAAVAKELEAAGLMSWMSDVEGEDANDFEARMGTFRLSMQLKGFFVRRRA